MIRHARPDDKMRVLVLAREFHRAAGLPFPFSPAHADALFRASIDSDDRLCLVLEVDGAIQGVLAAEAGPHPFGPFKIAGELMWWIEPAHRGRSAVGMISAFEDWARERGCQFVHMVGLGDDPAVGRLYQRRGYSAAERHFMKPL